MKLDQWEIGVLHRDHQSNDGACVRATWIKVPPDQADRSMDFYRTSVLPSLEDLEGFERIWVIFWFHQIPPGPSPSM